MFDEVAQAEQLFHSYLSHGRVFVGERQRDGHYAVRIRPVEAMKNPAFRFACEFWGVDRPAVEKTVADYNDQLTLNRHCQTAQELANALVEAANDRRVDAVRHIATFLRGEKRIQASDIAWLVWRMQKIAEWGDHAGLEDILDRLLEVCTSNIGDKFNEIISIATGRALGVWVALAMKEQAEASQPA